MVMFLVFRNSIIVMLGGGVIVIVIIMFFGKDGFEGWKYEVYCDVVGVLIVCDGYIGLDIIINKWYIDKECDVLIRKDF